MKKIIYIFSAFTLLFSFIIAPLSLPVYARGSEKLQLSARSAALYEVSEGKFLYTKNSDARLGMASTTKIVTAVIALTELDEDKIIEVDKRAVGIEGSSVYLEEGEMLSAKSLVYATLLSSANDAAAALAYEISGDIPSFAMKMNELAASLGLQNTNFTNPHGLDDKEHYTSAHDLALLTAYAIKNPLFLEIASTKRAEITSSLKKRTLVNHNKLLSSYEGCVGVKTGYTKKSGRSLVSAAERNGKMLISVTINAPDDWIDHKRMLDFGFSRCYI